MLSIGDRVYHRGAGGNGIVVTINNNFNRDKYGIKFFWKKYKRVDLHTLNGFLSEKLGIWGSENKIVPTPIPTVKRNSLTVIGKRGLDVLIRNICEIPRVKRYGTVDIAINYGTFSNVPTRNMFIINKVLISDKFIQCKTMIEAGVPVPDTKLFTADSGYIQKPYHSIGGKNITEFHNGDLLLGYLQKKVNKIREFRAHVFLWGSDQVPLIQEKLVEDTSQLTWNKKQGGSFHTIHQPLLGIYKANGAPVDTIKDVCIKACKVLNYDMGGVDIAMDRDGKLWIFEVNSRMGLKEQSLVTYKTMFWELYNLDIDSYRTERW